MNVSNEVTLPWSLLTPLSGSVEQPWALSPRSLLELEHWIVWRLVNTLTDVRVLGSGARPKMKEGYAWPPTIRVFLEAPTVDSTIRKGKTSKIEQSWSVLLVVDQSTDDAGALLSNIVDSLSGWKPAAAFGPLEWVDSTFEHEYSENNILYFPLSFKSYFVHNVEEQ